MLVINWYSHTVDMFSNRLLAQMGVLFKTEVVHVLMQLALQQNLNPRLAAKCKPPHQYLASSACVAPGFYPQESGSLSYESQHIQ